MHLILLSDVAQRPRVTGLDAFRTPTVAFCDKAAGYREELSLDWDGLRERPRVQGHAPRIGIPPEGWT